MAVYFIRAGNYIKIGYAQDPEQRIRELQTANPEQLEMLGCVEGGLERETALHNLFADFRANGEWFELTTDIMAYIHEQINLPPRSRRDEKRKGTKRRKESEMSLHDAFLLLVSESVIMRDHAGLPVRMGNGKTGFAIMIDGWNYINGRAVRVANPEVGGSGK